VLRYAGEGRSTSEIGIVLRDQHAIPDVKLATGERISAILSRNEMTPLYPEDMMNLMRQAQRIIDHLEAGNRKDIHNRRQLELTESRLRRLAKYYRESGRISSDWTYKRDQLRLMVQ
jgi:small subunit ribosomal protein S15